MSKEKIDLFEPDMFLENETVKLRVVRKSDIVELKEIALDLSIWEYFIAEISTEEELENYIEGLLSEYQAKRNVPFVIIDKKEDKIIGMSSYGNIAWRDRRIEIGWSWIGTAFQGKGFNTAYKHLMMNYAFEEMSMMRVEFKTDVLNLKARKALLKIGTTEEGVLRSHTLMHHDRRRDTIYYSILKSEWENKRG